jgi:hypothetical protein
MPLYKGAGGPAAGGYQHERGEGLFHTLEHARLCPRAKELIDQIACRTIWKNLLIICPGLCIVRERVKKQRPRRHAALLSRSQASACEYPIGC